MNDFIEKQIKQRLDFIESYDKRNDMDLDLYYQNLSQYYWLKSNCDFINDEDDLNNRVALSKLMLERVRAILSSDEPFETKKNQIEKYFSNNKIDTANVLSYDFDISGCTKEYQIKNKLEHNSLFLDKLVLNKKDDNFMMR